MTFARGRSRLDGVNRSFERGRLTRCNNRSTRNRHADADVKAEAMGLGWHLHEWSGQRVIEHSGGTIGQMSQLTVLPEHMSPSVS